MNIDAADSDESFYALLARFAKVQTVNRDDALFGDGLDMSSIAFTEFILELEELLNIDIDVDELDESIKTAEQLKERIFRYIS